MKETEKIESISLMRVLAIFLIVINHSILFYTTSWWNMGGIVVPLWVKSAKLLSSIDVSMFVFISGFLFGYLYLFKEKYRNPKSFIANKFRRLLIPYIFWGVVAAALPPSPFDWKSILVGSGHLWFLLMLFWVFCIAICCIQSISKANTFYSTLLIPIIYLVWLSHHLISSHHNFLCIEFALSFGIIFYIGFLCAKYHIATKKISTATYLCILSITVFTLYIFSNWEQNYIADNLIIRIFSYTFIVCLFVIFSKVTITKKFQTIITKLDQLSMGIYIFNQFVVNALLLTPPIHLWLNQHYMTGPVVIFFFGFFVPTILSSIFNKYKCLAWAIGGKN